MPFNYLRKSHIGCIRTRPMWEACKDVLLGSTQEAQPWRHMGGVLRKKPRWRPTWAAFGKVAPQGKPRFPAFCSSWGSLPNLRTTNDPDIVNWRRSVRRRMREKWARVPIWHPCAARNSTHTPSPPSRGPSRPVCRLRLRTPGPGSRAAPTTQWCSASWCVNISSSRAQVFTSKTTVKQTWVILTPRRRV